MIWSFKRKRHPDGSLSKYKARLCCHGGQQQWGINYWETYAPVVTWASVRTLLVMSKIHGMHTKSIDFVQAYPQADVKVPIYLHTPQMVILTGGHDKVLRLRKNCYGLKDAGRTWYEHLTDGLHALGFRPLQTDNCVMTRGNTIIVIYVDDCLIFAQSDKELQQAYVDIQSKYKVTDEGTIDEYLGIKLDHTTNLDGQQQIRMTQPLLIRRIIDAIPGMRKANARRAPATLTSNLTKDADGPPRKETWSYRGVVGMLNFLTNSTHPELAFATHQCARFCSDPRHSHELAIKHIVRYLLSTQRPNAKGKLDLTIFQGIIFTPDKTQSIRCYVDAGFAGDWNISWSEDAASVLSRTGYVITYAGCPIIWASKMQTEIALSTTESEYIALSQSMRDVIPLLDLINELMNVIKMERTAPIVHCTVFEDNNSCIELVKCPKMRPRTKHISIKYHHFRSKVKAGLITVERIDTLDQIADIFTKSLDEKQFIKLRKELNGW